MKKTKVPSLVTLSVLTAITVAFWIIFSVLRIFTTKPSPAVPPEILEPFSPNLNTTIIDKMQQRLYFEKGNE